MFYKEIVASRYLLRRGSSAGGKGGWLLPLYLVNGENYPFFEMCLSLYYKNEKRKRKKKEEEEEHLTLSVCCNIIRMARRGKQNSTISHSLQGSFVAFDSPLSRVDYIGGESVFLSNQVTPSLGNGNLYYMTCNTSSLLITSLCNS